jgi:hypothetical protein
MNKIFYYLIAIIVFVSCKNLNTENASSFIGTWELISRIDKTDKDSTLTEPSLGSDPIAILMYDSFENVSAHIMKRNRTDSISSVAYSNSNNSTSFNGYDSYFGTYSIDFSKHQVKHLIKGTLDKNIVGKTLIRNYLFSNDTLRLFFSTTNGTLPVTRTLIWVRVKK